MEERELAISSLALYLLNMRQLIVQAPQTFRSFFLDSLAKYANRTFISAPASTSTSSQRERFTFNQVLDRAELLAAWFQERGLGVGSRVAIGGGNCIE